jgi:hypothetical protein
MANDLDKLVAFMANALPIGEAVVSPDIIAVLEQLGKVRS